ncbi:MAG: rhodanese-like domain-containing protein [Rufibacter sp.]
MKLLFLLFFQFTLFSASFQETPAKILSPTEFKSQFKKEKGVLVDVRTPEEFAAGHLKNAKNSDWRGEQFGQEFQNWDKSKTYYLYCASGNRSGQALKLMQKNGFQHVYNIGGFKDLKTAGVKSTKGKK